MSVLCQQKSSPGAQGGERRGPPGRGGGGAKPGRRLDCPPGERRAEQRQASFDGPLPERPSVAIIGGGLAGLVCGLALAQGGARAVVFDTGEHGAGGRLASRSTTDGSLLPSAQQAGTASLPAAVTVDHAAQFFTASDPAFIAMVERWEAEGVVRRWAGPVGTVCEGGAFTPLGDEPRYVAVGGMRALAQHLAAGGAARELAAAGLLEVRRPVWVNSVRATAAGWAVSGGGERQGCFDAVVIAHNGKCANRLTSDMGCPAVHAQLRRLKLSAVWVVAAVFASPVPLRVPYEGAFVAGDGALSWAANNTAKLGGAGAEGGGAAALEAWTLVSTASYGKSNKVPQEAVPPEVAARVTAQLLEAFQRCGGVAAGGLPPLAFSRAQLWGAALPLNSPAVPCIWDPASRVGVAGDWVLEGGSMQAAALSGLAMAERIRANAGRGGDPELAIGLDRQFKRVTGEDIGQFPPLKAAPPPPAAATPPLQQQQQQRGQGPQERQTQMKAEQQVPRGGQQQSTEPRQPAPVGRAVAAAEPALELVRPARPAAR